PAYSPAETAQMSPLPSALCYSAVLRPEDSLTRVNQPLTVPEFEALRRCTERGQPFSQREAVTMTNERLRLQYTLRARGTPLRQS
ncbi:MAG: hypothetical protein ACQESR_26305, partial [Planctomycetota bacterium]